METTISEESPFGSFTDPRDGRVYRTVRIGEQVWMAENLDYGRFVPFEAGREYFPTLAVGDKWYYGNDEAIGAAEGGLYTWEAACESAPPGWHIPSKKEWAALVKFIVSRGLPADEVGKALKSREGWTGRVGGGTDAYGFNALPAGMVDWEGFDYRGEWGHWWMTPEIHPDRFIKGFYEWCSLVGDFHDFHPDGDIVPGCGYSIRCVKD